MQGNDSLAYPLQVPDVGNVDKCSAAILAVNVAPCLQNINHAPPSPPAGA